MQIALYRERIRPTDPRLGRHIHHDSRSKLFPFDTSGLALKSVRHRRRVPVFDQGQVGSCTGNAGVGCLGTDPYFETIAYRPVADARYPFDEDGALRLYSDATKADDYPGVYPPDDSGSDGLTVAKVLTSAGEIAGYRHTFNLDDALLALTVTPFITGTVWTEGMFAPDPDGRVHPAGVVAGGHEYVADELDVEQRRIWFTNSWGTGFGVEGRFWLTWDDYGTLLAQQGDVTVFTPLTQPAPAPIPQPADPADVALAEALRHRGWVTCRHVGTTAYVAHAAQRWLQARRL